MCTVCCRYVLTDIDLNDDGTYEDEDDEATMLTALKRMGAAISPWCVASHPRAILVRSRGNVFAKGRCFILGHVKDEAPSHTRTSPGFCSVF